MVAAAVIGAGVVGAVGSSVAGAEAAGATTSAANTAAGVQEQALQQQAQLAAPYTGLGTAAMSNYERLLGIGSGGSPQSIQAALAATPGYQFTQQQGETGILNAASAAGGVSGNTLTALDKYNTGLANQTYQTALNDAFAPVQLGQSAAAGQASNIQTGASNLGNIAIGEGNNLANIDIGTAAGISNAIGNAGNQYIENQTIGSLLNSGGGGGGFGTVTGIAGGGT